MFDNTELLTKAWAVGRVAVAGSGREHPGSFSIADLCTANHDTTSRDSHEIKWMRSRRRFRVVWKWPFEISLVNTALLLR